MCVDLGMEYKSFGELYSESDIETLHCPRMPETYHRINNAATRMMKDGVMLITSSRAALIDTPDVMEA